MKRELYQGPELQHPGPNEFQLAMRRKAETDPGYITRRWLANFPRHLYKYMPFNGANPDCARNLRTIAVQSNLWLSAPTDFNDPFDMKFSVAPDQDKVAVRKAIIKMGKVAKQREKLSRTETEKMVSRAMLNLNRMLGSEDLSIDRGAHGVTCLTPHPNSLLMWAHYAQSHRGICLQFRTSFDPGIFASAIPVEYSNVYPVVHWPSFPSSEVRAVMLRKGADWSYENEYRITTAGVSSRELGIAPRALTAIILGCNFSIDDFRLLRTILEEREAAGLPTVKILRASMGLSSYGIKCFKEKPADKG